MESLFLTRGSNDCNMSTMLSHKISPKHQITKFALVNTPYLTVQTSLVSTQLHTKY